MEKRRISARLEIEHQIQAALRKLEKELKDEEFVLPTDIMALVPPIPKNKKKTNHLPRIPRQKDESSDVQQTNGDTESIVEQEEIQNDENDNKETADVRADVSETSEPPTKMVKMEGDLEECETVAEKSDEKLAEKTEEHVVKMEQKLTEMAVYSQYKSVFITASTVSERIDNLLIEEPSFAMEGPGDNYVAVENMDEESGEPE